jgi:hypothetical protein
VALRVPAAALLCGVVLSAVFVGRGSLAQEEPVAPPFVAEAQPIAGVSGAGEGETA